ncbi:MAG: efflux RND transporter periplasmic adaptor subunit [Verrucomicrobia bacterium]|nr:efflux RND transporter periplasmic adaptor subunit [Verrucomicrobiota bacterium]
MFKRKLYIFVLLILAVVILSWTLFARMQRPTVYVAEAYTGTAVNAVTGTVTVLAGLDVRVKTEQRGRLKELLVDVGDVVEEGQVIATQHSEDLMFRLEQQRIRLAAAQARSAVALPIQFEVEILQRRIEATQLEVSLNQTPRSRLEIERLELQRMQAHMEREKIDRRENLDLLDSSVRQLEFELEQTVIRAPFSGEIVEIFAFPGDLLHSGNDVVRLVSQDRSAEMILSEEDFFGVEPGQPVTMRLASLPHRPISGTVSFLSPVADADRKTRALFVQLNENDQSGLTPGLTGEGYLVKSERPSTVLIPRRSLMFDRVAIARDGVVEIRRVEPGFVSLNLAEIVSGIQPGEWVVVDNPTELQNGSRIRTRTR